MRTLNQKGFSPVEIILVLVILSILGFTGWWVWNSGQKTNRNLDKASQNLSNKAESKKDTTETANQKAAIDCVAPAGYVVYKNVDIGFCFSYPKDWGNVSLDAGIIDASQETGTGYTGSFSLNDNASFALQKDDWSYNGPGRGGPIHAVGFKTYEQYVVYDAATSAVKVNTDEKYLVASNSMLDFEGAMVTAHRKFVATPNYGGIAFQLNVASSGGFDPESDNPDTLVTAAQYTIMQTVLDSVLEL